MKTLSLILFTAGISATTLTASAQQVGERPKMDPQQMAQKQTEQIKRSVTNLTPDEESKILAVEQDFAKAAQDARTNSNGDRDAMRAKMQPLRQDRDAKIKGILTSDQYAEYQKMEESRQQMGGKRTGGGQE
jgi:hypothetical protein